MGSLNRVTTLYRQLLKAAHRLPESKRAAAIQDIKKSFCDNKSENNAEKISKLVAVADSKLSYLKIVTPKALRSSSTDNAKQKYIMQGDKLVEGTVETHDKTCKSSIDPEDLNRHHRLLRRQHFMR